MAGSSSAAARPTKFGEPRTLAFLALAALATLVVIAAVWTLLAGGAGGGTVQAVSEGLASRGFWTAVAVGLAAQTVDGALGMAYGITSTTFLLSTGVPPAAASASVHVAEIFTTAFSGLSHWRLGNVNGALFRRLLIPGAIGAVAGAYLLTSVDGETIKPFVSVYLLVMGLYVLSKAFRTLKTRREPPRAVVPLALGGGFVDAVGGGGWGPVVTTTLVGGGQDPRTSIGTVNAAEFFIALASGLSFSLLGGLTHWTTIAGLVVGGLFAAPIAALLVRVIPARALMVVVGLLIAGLSLVNLAGLFG
ncbi:MAG TPA: sulfite exporter TauE/SafE family protein [Methylobacterium sp.]|uniref:sulfite exporter TauE/SafE family protein n=1 Tax=Methylorubrum sp. B1-46 TaxID=2897334 RepID=UPI001E2976A5|nr:sulfite exporter TauE/SafE family protein [Methylorubrum sp. B1-46]UGB25285.1 sulfite exporter TauE/SafE family protein [Methylorubrum sp. B1-46]HEV2544527.1 sulfite exporter TauE/SafE family protein [Methylobacterium sp.]